MRERGYAVSGGELSRKDADNATRQRYDNGKGNQLWLQILKIR